MSLHLRIQAKLKEKGLRVADLARATGVSAVAAGKWFLEVTMTIPTHHQL